MKKTTCPFCGRKFSREPRALLENKYCRHCIFDRIKASEGKQLPPNTVLIQVSPSYYIIK